MELWKLRLLRFPGPFFAKLDRDVLMSNKSILALLILLLVAPKWAQDDCFDLEFLESETALAGGGFIEKWTKVWNSEENKCNNSSIKENFCLPRALKLNMSLKGKDKKTVSDSQVLNLCVPPCNPEIYK